MQIDIGFGDVIVPEALRVSYPTLLDFPAPVLSAYPREEVAAEKLEAIIKLGLLNSRLKDFYDLALLSRMYSFNAIVLIDAVRATFRHRETAIDTNPVGLTEAYYSDAARFAEKSGDLLELVGEVRLFAIPVLRAAATLDGETNNEAPVAWSAGGPWR